MKKASNEMKVPKQPTVIIALIPVAFLLVLLLLTLFVWKGQPQMPLILAAMVTSIVGYYLGFTWADIEGYMIQTLTKSFQACLILLAVGMLIGVWLLSGTVPTMIYYGLEFLNPKYFLVIATIICCVVSVATGSSWTTAGTVGVAFTGIGAGLGIPPAMVAGAIVSGAYFGDKMSPLSDTTNLAPAMAECNLFDHIQHMLYTTGPTMVIALILYFILGMKYGSGSVDAKQIDEIITAIKGAYNINILLLLPPVLVVLMVVKKIPAIPGLFGGIMLGAIFYFIFQKGDTPMLDAAGKVMYALHYGTVSETGQPLVDKLFTRGGYHSMLWTISLIIASMCFGGAMEIAGCLQVLTNALLKFVKSTGGLVLATICSCLFVDVISGSQYLSIVIPGRMYRLEFRKRGLHPKNLSRCLEDAGTLASPLIPWNTGGAFMYQTLGVNPFVFLPYAFLNIINPLVSIFYGYTGITMEKLPPEELAKIEKENKEAEEKAKAFSGADNQ